MSTTTIGRIDEGFLECVEEIVPTGRLENKQLREAIEASQRVLLRYLLPDSTVMPEECISELLHILDNKDIVKLMKGNTP